MLLRIVLTITVIYWDTESESEINESSLVCISLMKIKWIIINKIAFNIIDKKCCDLNPWFPTGEREFPLKANSGGMRWTRHKIIYRSYFSPVKKSHLPTGTHWLRGNWLVEWPSKGNGTKNVGNHGAESFFVFWYTVNLGYIVSLGTKFFIRYMQNPV